MGGTLRLFSIQADLFLSNVKQRLKKSMYGCEEVKYQLLIAKSLLLLCPSYDKQDLYQI